MKRRALLTSMGAGMAGVAGCLTGNSNSGGSTPQQNQGSPVAVSTPSGSKAKFELTSINLTKTAEVGSEYEFTITVKNTGDQAGVYSAPASVRKGDSVHYDQQAMAEVYVEAGKEKTANVSLPPFESVGTLDVRFAEPDNTWQVTVKGPELPMGAGFDVDGFEISFESIDFTQTVDYGGAVTFSAGEGEKYAVANVKLTNIGDRERWMPNATNFRLKYGPSAVGPVTDTGYRKDIMAAGAVKQVKLPYTVEESARRSDIVFRYNGQREDKRAFWSPKFSGSGSSSGGETTPSQSG